MLKPIAAGKTGVKRKAAESAAPAGAEHFAWLELPDSAAFVSEGLPAKAPAVVYDKQKKAFQMAHGMLQELVGDEMVGDCVTFEHDEEGDTFPDVSTVVTESFGEATSYCVARCASKSKWAVGTGYGWKTREVAAKLALAIAIAEDSGEIATWAGQDGDFGQFALVAGIIEQAALPEGAKGTGALQYPVYGLALEGSSTLVDQGMAATAPAVVHDDAFKDCFSIASPMLADLIGEGSRNVVFEHDTEGETYAEVKAAIVAAGGEDNCFCVAICKEANIWAVGIASGWKNREKAAKVALALALADDQNTFAKCIEKYRDFALLCVEAELITKDRVPSKNQWWDFGEPAAAPAGAGYGKEASKGGGKAKGPGKGAPQGAKGVFDGWESKGCKGGKGWEDSKGGKGDKSWKGGNEWEGGKGGKAAKGWGGKDEWGGGKGDKGWGGKDEWGGGKGDKGWGGGDEWGGGKGGGKGGGGKAGKMEKMMELMNSMMGKGGDGW